ncbi:MAG: hypothetical protein IKQ35_03300 [Bacilli bacterium]|nr:hypothetical protein [Bacilli bacterium]
MEKINVDTQELKSSGNDLKRLSNNLSGNFDDFFDLIKNVPLKNIWTGKVAETYTKNAMTEKDMYKNYSESINKLGDVMVEHAEKLEQLIRDNRIEYK